MATVMPCIPIDRITDPMAAGVARRITKGSVNRLYASRPKTRSGSDQYVWRMVAFYLSRNPAHQCMPVCADFPLFDDPNSDYKSMDFRGRADYRKSLDEIADTIVNAVPRDQWFGVARWGRAFGVC